MSNLDYNKTLFLNNKIIEGKKIVKKNKTKGKAKALAKVNPPPNSKTNVNIPTEINVPTVIKTNNITVSKPFLQPMHQAKYVEFKQPKNTKTKMTPNVSTSTSSTTQNSLIGHRLPFSWQNIEYGSPEWYSYTGFTPPPIVYTREWTQLIEQNEKAQEQYIAQQKASKIPTPVQKLNPKVLIVACEYPGTKFKLNGCYNDAEKFKTYISGLYPNAEILYLNDKTSVHNYDITITDINNPARWPSYEDPTFPTRDIVFKALTDLCNSPNRLLYLFLAGHGGTADDIPAPIEGTLVDTDSNGVIKNTYTVSSLDNPKHKSTYYFCNDYGEMNDRSPLYDWEMYKILQKVTSSQNMYLFTDCCHSGTIFNLPFVNLGNFMYRYDSSGNIVTQSAQETDDFGHGVYDSSGNPIIVQNNLYNILNDISNNKLNLPLTTTDINTLMTDATTEVPYYDKASGTTKTTPKLSFKSAEFPSLTNMKGNIIHFSGTRDNKFSFESVIYDSSGNEIDVGGAFTTHFKKLWDLGLETFTVQKAYTCLIGLMNNPEQIPVCSTSKYRLYNDTDLLVDFKPQITPQLIAANKNVTITELTKIKKLIKNKSNLLNYYDPDKIKDILIAKNTFKPVPKPKKLVINKFPKTKKKKLNKKQKKIAKNIEIGKLLKI